MLSKLIMFFELLIKIKEFITILIQTKKLSIPRKQEIIASLAKIKEEVKNPLGTDVILSTLENMIKKIQDGSKITEIIDDLQLIGSQINSLFSEEKDMVNTINLLINEIEKLLKNL